jgi:hypothetical protein
MFNFRSGLAFDLVDLGWFQIPRGGCDRYSDRLDCHFYVNSDCRGQIRHNFELLERPLELGYRKAVWRGSFGCVFEVWPAPGAQESLHNCAERLQVRTYLQIDGTPYLPKQLEQIGVLTG